MLLLDENPAWSVSPKTYIEQVYQALGRHGTYGGMPRSRKCRCVRLTYAGSCHVDIVPYLTLGDGRQVIVNRDSDEWRTPTPKGSPRGCGRRTRPRAATCAASSG